MADTLCFDYDPLLYNAGSVGETRTIKVVHRASGDEYEFANRTAFWGHHKKKAGGWLAEYNASKSADKRRMPDEFDITDIQTPEPLENCLHTLKQMIVAVKEATGAEKYYGYSGRGTVFREDVSTIVKYKGNREGTLRPVHLEAMKDYLIRNHGCTVITGIEADDACSIDCRNGWKTYQRTGNKTILAFTDKDYYQVPGHIYHVDSGNMHEYGEGFGWLAISDDRKKVTGRGRMWLYFQVMAGDDADNYFPNSANPGVRWGDVSAFETLKDAKNDKEAFEALVTGYKRIYPSPRRIVGWRGFVDPKTMKILKPGAEDFEIDVDWLYCLNENFNLARMLRSRDEGVLSVSDVLDRLKIER